MSHQNRSVPFYFYKHILFIHLQPQLAPTGPSTNITTKNEASSTPPSSAPPLFNISQMLEQITQQVTGIPSTNFTDQKALIDGNI